MRKKNKKSLEKEWREKLVKETAEIEKGYRELVLKRITELETLIAKKNLETPTLKRLFDHTKRRFGIVEKNEENLIALLTNILEEKKGIATIREIWFELLRKNIEISTYKLEKIVLDLSKRGIIEIHAGVISSKRPSDTKLGKEILMHIKDRESIRISELSRLVNRDEHLIKVIIEDLKKAGLVAIDEKNDVVICV